MTHRSFRDDERGAALVEFAIAATVFMTVMFGVLEFSRLLWVHNALTDATRRGARYALTRGQHADALAAIQRMAVYGNTDVTGTPMVDGLTTDKVKVNYDGYTVGGGTVTVYIDSYDYSFVLPFFGTTLRLPAYSTTLTGETAGFEPAPI